MAETFISLSTQSSLLAGAKKHDPAPACPELGAAVKKDAIRSKSASLADYLPHGIPTRAATCAGFHHESAMEHCCPLSDFIDVRLAQRNRQIYRHRNGRQPAFIAN
ncbi:hypothetical protein FAZ95_14820 [Trinickia violacea]|uniref:Uncharacterized protein n=1 Tax=Trinickia violacea TaxID=2571746 RepID=A0A4P8ITF4_9BURK|nr:hypothetical protein [Trinickia violacea]QCP50334.1 hypothetical protein FAZ95_14820 [Trinickia violacea]